MGLKDTDPLPTPEELEAALLPHVDKVMPNGLVLRMTRDTDGTPMFGVEKVQPTLTSNP